jgi:O-antigen/teichoic acid export membrane protein
VKIVTVKKEKDLAKNTIIISFGQVLPRFTTLITLPILTAFLTKAEYGIYDLINTLVSLVIPIIVLKLDMGVFRFLIEHRNDVKRRVSIISTTYLFITCTSIIGVIIIFFLLKNIESFTKLLICVYFLLDVLFITSQQIVRGLSKNIYYALSSIIYAVLNMIFIVLLVKIRSEGLNGLLISMDIGALSSILFLLFFSGLWKDIHFVFSKSLLREMLSYSWPLIPNSLSAWVMNLSDRIIVMAVLGIEMNAVYAVANKIPNLLNLVQSSFSAAWQENASLSLNDYDTVSYYSKMFDILFRLLVGVTGLLIGLTPLLFVLLISGVYDEAYYQMPLLFAAMFFSTLSSFMGGIYAAHKRTKSVGITTSLAALCNFFVNLLLINFIGLYAASFSTFISYFLLTIFRMINIRKFQKMAYDFRLIISCLFVLVIMCFLSHKKIYVLSFVNGAIGIIWCIIINRKLLHRIINKLLLKK